MDLNQPASGAVRHSRAEPASTLIDRADAGTSTKAGPRRVLVATDTSETSAGAERAGIELSSRVGATLVFLSVIDTSRLRLPGGLFHTRVDQVRDQRESALAASVTRARELGIAAQFIIWEGDPGASVIDAAEAEGADLIVIGSHGRGPVGRLLLGSVSSYVVDHGRMPVMVIRPGQHLDDVLAVTGADVDPTAFAEGRRTHRSM
jgi:nucleotide-binding universal stress UspA family protein